MRLLLSWWAKYPVLLIAVCIALVAVVWGFVSSFGSRMGFSRASVDKERLPLDDARYKAIANWLVEEFNKAGTDDERYFELLRGLNPDELKYIFNLFGKQTIEPLGSAASYFGYNKTGDLVELLQGEFKGRSKYSEMAALWGGTGLWRGL